MTSQQVASFDDLSLGELRRRRSQKWAAFPSDVLPAFVAEMDFAVAPEIKAELLSAVERDDCGYAWPVDLAEAFAEFTFARYGCSVEPPRVIVVPDVMSGIADVLRALTTPRDRVVINPPIYGPFFNTIRDVGRRAIAVPLVRTRDGKWDIDLDGVRDAFASGARAYLLCNPHNPVGRVFSRDQLLAVAELAVRYDALVIADEIHAPLTLPGATHIPFVSVSEATGARAVTVTSASKGWNLSGLKCAVMVAGSHATREQLSALPCDLRDHIGHLGAIATIAAFRRGRSWLDALIAHLDRNRFLLGELLASSVPGVRYAAPEAGYLAWLDCSALGIGPDPAATFLARGRVALSHGPTFGREGAYFARLNMGTSRALLGEIVARMARSLARGESTVAVAAAP